MTQAGWDALDEAIGENSEHVGITQWLDTGIPELNYAISGDYKGGLPVGRCVEIFGPASCGKTFLATMAMAAAQKAGGIAGFSDHERSFEPHLAQTLGLDMDPKKFRYLKPKTFEESVDIAIRSCEIIRGKKLIPDEAPIVWVFDSVAAMIPHSKLFNDKGERRQVNDYNMRDKLALAAACSQSYPTLVQWAADNNMLVLLLNQIRLKPGVMYGDPTTTPGGQAAEFFASVRINIGKKEITNGKKGDDKETLGFEIAAKCVKNKVSRPHLKAKWQVRFNVDGFGVKIDQIATNLDFLVRAGLIEKDGTRVVWDGKKMFQSVLEKELQTDPEAYSKLMALYDAVPPGLEVPLTAD